MKAIKMELFIAVQVKTYQMSSPRGKSNRITQSAPTPRNFRELPNESKWTFKKLQKLTMTEVDNFLQNFFTFNMIQVYSQGR